MKTLIFLLPVFVFGQEFESASIQLSAGRAQALTRPGVQVDGSLVRYSALSLRVYLRIAYGLKSYQISAPRWMASEKWDISVKLPPGAGREQIPAMMQKLLRDRFEMKMHRETRKLYVYGLTVEKHGLKMEESRAGTAATGADVPVETGGAATTLDYGNGASFTFGENRFEGRKLSMPILANDLTRFADLPVVDMTGLKGNYDFTMEFRPKKFRAMMVRLTISQGARASPEMLNQLNASVRDTLFNAAGKLGLQLRRQKTPVEMLVIDSALTVRPEN